MADSGAFSAGERCRHAATLEAQARMADGVDTAMKAVEAAGLDALCDGLTA